MVKHFILTASLLFLLPACAQEGSADDQNFVIIKKLIPDNHPQLLGFYQQNYEYSQAFLRNALDEKHDTQMRAELQLEKRDASRVLIEKQNSFDEQAAVVASLEEELKDLKEKNKRYFHVNAMQPLGARDHLDQEIQDLEKRLFLAKEELKDRQYELDLARNDYEAKSLAYADFSAQVKAKLDELNALELYSNLGLDDLYKSL